MGGLKHLALLVIVLFVGPSVAEPTPDPGPDPSCPQCYPPTDFGYPDLLYILLVVIELVLALLLGIIFAIVSIVASLLGPATDTTTLLGALNGPTELEGFLGSLPIVLKYLNLINVPTAILG
ncbi:uncharacterized protein LOC129002770 isoform X4 [Macrosteles quadrilineatus]|uniref:uncharacterized protein LOC129002770 isoform X4 n=1 Tax=Macrosteles quadrilineatus TaxID=74068 RepID=UPI0023E1731E|nr:uncharacterized protein LOC129002770 isoform X4 [Macrosteles quadrilineatus]